MKNIPDPGAIFPNKYKTSCFIKNVIKAPNITVGDYTYYDDENDPGNTVIGNDVWIDRKSVIMPGVTIGDGSIIGAYSIVTPDILPYSIAGGNPAGVIKKRFDGEMTDLQPALMRWDFAPGKLADFLPILCDPDMKKVRKTLKDTVSKQIFFIFPLDLAAAS